MSLIECSDYASSVVISTDNNRMKMDGGKKQPYLFFHHLLWNEAHIISNGNPPYGYTADCSMWWLIVKLSPTLTPCWRVTKRDKMAYGKDLTLQMSLLFGFERIICALFLFLFWRVHEILSGKTWPLQVSLSYSLKSIVWKHAWVVRM